ncbi:hypothetical protein BJ165DRAFT_1496837 [Panaeolus papilionaceus]|nr:hypothetical protein BJ165DRAFT_1496837 [Panaeolus papilionaceus]
MQSLGTYARRARAALRDTYYQTRFSLVHLLWKMRVKYDSVKSTAKAYRHALSLVRRRKTRSITSWGKRRRKAFQAAVKRSKSGMCAPVPRLLTSNDPPDEEETVLLRNALEGAEAQLKVYTDEMRDKLFWDPANAPKSGSPPPMIRLEAHISDLKSLSSAIRRFPSELLQVIFTIGLFPRPRNPEIHYPQDALEWPWAISQVCRHWRNTALAMPELWSYLPPLMMSRVQLSGEMRLRHAMFKTMVERSKDMGLHVIINSDTAKRTPRDPTIDFLVHHSERWESATMNMSPSQLIVFGNIKGRLPRLKRLQISLWYASMDDTVDGDIFAIAPQLSDITCYSSDVELQFPQAQLLRCSLRSHSSVTQVQQIISSNAAFLQMLSLGSGLLPLMGGSLTLPNLTQFYMISNSYDDIGGLGELVLPALEELHISASHTTILSDLLALLQRSSRATINAFPLKKLSFGSKCLPVISLDSESFVSILTLAAGIQFLDCPLPGLSVLKCLAQTDPESALVPLMEYCKFSTSSQISASCARALNNICRSRCELPAEVSDDSLDMAFVKRLQCFVIGTYYGGSAYDDRLTRCQRTLEYSWTGQSETAAPTGDDAEHNSTTSDENEDETRIPGVAMTKTLQKLLKNILRGKRRYGNTVSQNPFSKMYISRQQAKTLVSHLALCKTEQIDIHCIATARIQGYEFDSLRRCLVDTPARVKKMNPYLEELETVLKDLLDTWIFAVDENLPSVHWVYYDRYPHVGLFYIPQTDPLRSTSTSMALVLDLDHILYEYFEEYKNLFEELSICADNIY